MIKILGKLFHYTTTSLYNPSFPSVGRQSVVLSKRHTKIFVRNFFFGSLFSFILFLLPINFFSPIFQKYSKFRNILFFVFFTTMLLCIKLKILFPSKWSVVDTDIFNDRINYWNRKLYFCQIVKIYFCSLLIYLFSA